MMQEGHEFDPEKSHSKRVFQSVQSDPDLMLRDIHKRLVGDEYGNRGLIEDVKKNTKFRYEREEERRQQMKYAKIIGAILSSVSVSWIFLKEKLSTLWALIN